MKKTYYLDPEIQETEVTKWVYRYNNTVYMTVALVTLLMKNYYEN